MHRYLDVYGKDVLKWIEKESWCDQRVICRFHRVNRHWFRLYRIHYSNLNTIKNMNLFFFCIEIRLSIHDLHYCTCVNLFLSNVCYFLLFPLYTIVLYEYNCVLFRMQLFFIVCVIPSHFSLQCYTSSHFSVLISVFSFCVPLFHIKACRPKSFKMKMWKTMNL